MNPEPADSRLSPNGGRMITKRMKSLVLLALLAMGVVFHLSCGEGSLPPPSEKQTGQLTVTGYAD
jgi:hypothetical protein